MPDLASIPEHRANPLLRRLDWRFLLPLRGFRTVFCPAGDPLAEAVALGLEARAADQGADLAVLSSPDTNRLRDAYSRLRPGGALYAEWRKPGLGGAARPAALAARAGFVGIGCHLPWPWARPAGPAYWIPLGPRRSLELVLERRLAPAHAGRVTSAFRLAERTGLLGPVCLVAQRPPAADPPAAPLLLATGGRRSVNKAVGLVVRDGDDAPRSVVKFARMPAEDAGLRREWDALRTIQTIRPSLAGVPRPLSLDLRAGRVALRETAVHGRRVLDDVRSASFVGTSLRVTDWLLELAGDAVTVPRESWWDRLVEQPLAEFVRRYRDVLGDEEMRSAWAELDALPDLPLVVEHRDLSPWNVLIDDQGRLGVLDWESAELQGLPGLDLPYFLTHWALAADGALDDRRLESYHRSRTDRTPTGSVIAACEHRYCTALGIDPAALRPLRILAWVVHALSEHRGLVRDAGGRPRAARLQAAFFLGLLRAELATGAELAGRQV